MFMWCCTCISWLSVTIARCLFGTNEHNHTIWLPFGYPKHKEATKKMNRSVKHGQKTNDKKNALCDEDHSEDEGLTVSPSCPGFNSFSLRYTWCNQGQRWLHSEMHWIVIREAEVVMKRRKTKGCFPFHPRSLPISSSTGMDASVGPPWWHIRGDVA